MLGLDETAGLYYARAAVAVGSSNGWIHGIRGRALSRRSIRSGDERIPRDRPRSARERAGLASSWDAAISGARFREKRSNCFAIDPARSRELREHTTRWHWRSPRESAQFAPAIEALQKALQLRPDWPEALIGIGSLLERSGAIGGGGIGSSSAQSSSSPIPVEALTNLGNVVQQRGRQFAMRSTAIARQSRISPIILMLIPISATRSARSVIADVTAAQNFEIALDLNPQSPIAVQNLGVALLKSGRSTDAHDLYLRAVAS